MCRSAGFVKGEKEDFLLPFFTKLWQSNGMDWNIRERAAFCTATGKPFKEGDVFYTMLFEEKGELVRKDLSEEAWTLRNDNIHPLSFWRSIFKEIPQEEKEALRREDAESELRKLLDQNKPENEKLCYLLALLLERKRIFRAREHATLNDQPVIIYEHSETQETFVVPEKNFRLSEVEALQSELKASSRIFTSTPNPIPHIPHHPMTSE